jgi:ribosome biogenesis protein ERB1
MARTVQEAAGKRKRTSDEPTGPDLISEKLDLQTLTDQEEEGEASDSSSDGSVEDFPEVDLGDDTEEEEGSSEAGDKVEQSGEPGDEEDAEGNKTISDESADEDEDSDSDDLHIYPKSKDVISDITGQVKRVYPDINPEYDSDSSTEDVCAFFLLTLPLTVLSKFFFSFEGSKPRRPHSNASV